MRVWWVAAGAPWFGPLGTDLIAFTGWWAVGLVGAAAVAYRRRWRSACLSCGRAETSRQPARPPRWARWAASVAIGGWLVRLLAQLAVGFGRSPLQGGGSLLVFEVGFVLAGTVLPPDLGARAWGRRACLPPGHPSPCRVCGR